MLLWMRQLQSHLCALGFEDEEELLTVVQYRPSGSAPQASSCDALSGAHPMSRVIVSESGLGGNLLRWVTGTGDV